MTARIAAVGGMDGIASPDALAGSLAAALPRAGLASRGRVTWL